MEKVKPGQCGNCGKGSFKLQIIKRQLLRYCKNCREWIIPDTLEVIRRGKVKRFTLLNSKIAGRGYKGLIYVNRRV